MGFSLMAPITLKNPEAGQGLAKGSLVGQGPGIRVTAEGSKWAWVVLPKREHSSYQVAFLKGGPDGRGSRVVIAIPETEVSSSIETSGQTYSFFKSVQVYPLKSGKVGVFFEPIKPFGFRVLNDRLYFYERHPNASKLIRLRRILIAPGHGGKDPGAVGPDGVLEKDVTLMLAKELADNLKNLGFGVFLTRNDDRFVPLEQRARIAASFEADILLSIHTNASDDVSQDGFEGYIWGEPSDAQASKVALRENEGSLTKPKEIEAMIGRLKTNAAQVLSYRAACLTMDGLIEGLGLVPKGVLIKKAPFVVLQGLDIPAFLLEVGFITNPKMAVKLKSRVFQKKLANAITQAIETFQDSDDRILLGAL
jgi:N-acetylmuramoyl-L-alanine amidase